jgi:sialidase-1
MPMMSAPGQITLELPPGAGNPRNSEGSFIGLKDGRILLVYTRFYGGGGDSDAAILAGRYSSDGGRTWSGEDQMIIPNEGAWNVMSVSLLRLTDGRIALLYLVKNENYDCRPRLRFSEDEARTWSEPIWLFPDVNYIVVNNDRLVQLSSGRIIVPTAARPWRADGVGAEMRRQPAHNLFCLSDDGGRTWRRSAIVLPPEGSKSGLQEPGVIELRDGRLLAWARTDVGCQLICHSEDGGESWSAPQRSEFISPLSPMAMKRIPSTGDLLAIWNDHSGRFPIVAPPGRQPLAAAISRDEGKSWENHRQIESDLSRGYCYTAVSFTDDDHILLGYCAGPRSPGPQLSNLRVRRLPVKWLYE